MLFPHNPVNTKTSFPAHSYTMKAYKSAVSGDCAYNGRKTGRAGQIWTWAWLSVLCLHSDLSHMLQKHNQMLKASLSPSQDSQASAVWDSEGMTVVLKVWEFEKKVWKESIDLGDKVKMLRLVLGEWMERGWFLKPSAWVLLISEENIICIKHWRKCHEKWDRITQLSLIHCNKAFTWAPEMLL